jgi:phage host-nuclease inhibitor protein Gam
MATATLSAEPDELLDDIDSREDVDDLLEEASDLKREANKRERKMEKETADLHDQKEEIEEKIEEKEAKHRDFIERRREAIAARKEAIRQWAEEHQDVVLEDVDGKTYDSVFGSVSYRTKRFNFNWIDKDVALEALEEMGHDDLIRIQKKVPKKSTLKDHPDLVRKLDGVEAIEEHDQASVDVE